MLVDPGVGNKKTFVDEMFINQGFYLGNFMSCVKITFTSGQTEGCLIDIHVGADLVSVGRTIAGATPDT